MQTDTENRETCGRRVDAVVLRPPRITPDRMHDLLRKITKTIPQSRFDYIDFDLGVEVLHEIACGDGWVYVIGHRDHGSYEWVSHSDLRRMIWSNVGYSSVAACLRDGLIIGCGDDEGRDEVHGSIGGEEWCPLPDRSLPRHLQPAIPYLVCTVCGRKELSDDSYGCRCGMTQPDGSRCLGVFT